MPDYIKLHFVMEYNRVQCCMRTIETVKFSAKCEYGICVFLVSFGTGPV